MDEVTCLAPVEPLTIDIYIIACDTNTMLNINSSLWKRSLLLMQVSIRLSVAVT